MGTRAVIDHSALRHNLSVARQAAPASHIWAVVKANAYGHGVLELVSSLEVEGFAVARLDEAEQLRSAGETRPLLIMGGAESTEALERAVALDCQLALHDEIQAERLLRARLARPARIWLKINTGMNRLGMPAESAVRLLQRFDGSLQIEPPIGLMTHLANADDSADPFTDIQCRRLRAIPGAEACPLNIGNSAGILAFAAARSDWVRPGIMLYGVSPFIGETAADRDLRPVMTLEADLMAINACCAGDRVGYGGTYQCPENMPVGVVGIGYGDGYPRHAAPGTPVLLRGRRVPLIGRVSMDTITVDLRTCRDAAVGDRAVLWGQGLPVEEIAASAGTIGYELLTSVTSRVVREHHR